MSGDRTNSEADIKTVINVRIVYVIRDAGEECI